MNKNQQFVIWLGIIALIVALIIPPWNGISKNYKSGVVVIKDYLGYSLIFSPPNITKTVKVGEFMGQTFPDRVEKKYQTYSIDWMRLSITIGIILLITVGLLLSFKESKKNISENIQ